MIKIALKHFILETCINRIFAGIFMGFSKKEPLLKNVKVGERFRSISLKRDMDCSSRCGALYFNCLVTDACSRYFVIKGAPFTDRFVDGEEIKGLYYDTTHIYYENILNFKR